MGEKSKSGKEGLKELALLLLCLLDTLACAKHQNTIQNTIRGFKAYLLHPRIPVLKSLDSMVLRLLRIDISQERRLFPHCGYSVIDFSQLKL